MIFVLVFVLVDYLRIFDTAMKGGYTVYRLLKYPSFSLPLPPPSLSHTHTHSAAVFGDSSGFGFGDEEDNLFSSAQETPPQPQPTTKVDVLSCDI